MAEDDALEYPDAVIKMSVKCENGELESGFQQLNPILQEIVRARAAALGNPDEVRPLRGGNPHFGRLTFSQKVN